MTGTLAVVQLLVSWVGIFGYWYGIRARRALRAQRRAIEVHAANAAELAATEADPSCSRCGGTGVAEYTDPDGVGATVVLPCMACAGRGAVL